MPLEKLGPYKLEKLLGRGGMGAVYVGVHESTGERAAVKLLSGHLADDPNFRERFQQEIETLKQLLTPNHPNIVQIIAHGEEQANLYYVMELVEGRCVQDELAVGRRFTWREVARFGIGIAQALKHAHDRGIIHRDLKPANLLIDTQDHIKLTDFGIAKLYGGTNVTAEGGVLGTADYMAPEQAHGQPVTSRCDLYALGSVLYALLTGKPPFAAKTLVEVLSALHKDKPVPVRRLAPDTPEEFDRIILQLLEKDPQKRIPTALALANRLKAMEHALSLETRVMGPDDLSDAPGTLIVETPPSAAKTEIVNPASFPTAPLSASDGEEYRLSADAPTMATGNAGVTPSSRTALGTQSGKRTGSGSDSHRGTAAERDNAARAADVDKISRFTTVSEEELRGHRERDDTPLKQWSLVAVLAVAGLILIAGAAWLATRPPSADQLYDVVTAAAERGEADELIPVADELARFLELYPSDPRAPEMKEYANDLERYRLGRRLDRSAGRGAAPPSMTPVERAYQEALQVANSDPETALARFQALLAIYDDAASNEASTAKERANEHCLELAREQIAKLKPEVEQLTTRQQAAVQQRMERAEQLAATNRPAAEKIWQGVITLYGDKPWAKVLVGEAQAHLAEALKNAKPEATTP